MSVLSEATEAAKAADDVFMAAVRAAGFTSRWDAGATASESVHKAYMAKLAADAAMHLAFNDSRRAAMARAKRED